MLCKPEKEKLLFMNASANLYVRRIFMRCFMSCNQQRTLSIFDVSLIGDAASINRCPAATGRSKGSLSPAVAIGCDNLVAITDLEAPRGFRGVPV